MLEALTKIIPIILLLALGYLIKHKRWAAEEQMAVLKKGIINIALPAVLFLTFKNMDLRVSYLAVSLFVFVFLWVLYYLGLGIKGLIPGHSEILPFMVTGCSFGLLGIPLFVGVYGVDHAGAISIYGIGHEFFVWFVYLTLLKGKLGGVPFGKETLIGFAKSPMIIAIVAGVTANLTGMKVLFDNFFLLEGLELTLESLSAVTTPLILMVVGYGIRIEKDYVKPALGMVVIRCILFLGLGYIAKTLVINPMMGEMSLLQSVGFFTFLILPPPYSSAIFIHEYSTEENTYIANNVLVMSTILCVFLFGAGVLMAGY